MLLYGYELAKEGYYVCLFDAYLHGELNTKNKNYSTFTLKNIVDIYKKTAKSINILIDRVVWNFNGWNCNI
jgi:hypothetical protein